MINPHFHQQEFIDYLTEHGFEIVSTDYWDKYSRIIFKKDGHTFPLQAKDVYHFPEVCRICMDFGVNPPPDHKKCYDQYMYYLHNIKNKKKDK